MRKNNPSGAGASVSSGADYQARVGGYAIAAYLSNVESAFSRFGKLVKIGFETREDIDDINISFDDGTSAFIQAKASISYSISENSSLISVLEQFYNQYVSTPDPIISFVLATRSSSSKKIVQDLRTALNAFRSENEKEFFRDQPKELQKILRDLRRAIALIASNTAHKIDDAKIDEILSRSFVLPLDVATDGTLEHGIKLALDASGYRPSSLTWGKIVSDCVEYAKNRQTVSIEELDARYSRFKETSAAPVELDKERLFEIVSGDSELAVGKEFLICRVRDETGPFSKGLAILELNRFDEECRERLKFAENSVELLNGITLELIARAATSSRILEIAPTVAETLNDEPVTMYPINSDESFEEGLCAEQHRKRLQNALDQNKSFLRCLHCEKPVSSVDASLVELGSADEPEVGLVHSECLSPPDRILGRIHNDFFADHPELRNFDIEGWFSALHGGQRGVEGARLLNNSKPVLAWGGLDPSAPAGRYVVEVLLRNGSRETVTQRNSVHRLTRNEAETFARSLNDQFKQARAEDDPFCYTDQSKGFGKRSMLLEEFGGSEELLEVESARVRDYKARFAARYSQPGYWYAPLAYLKGIESENPIAQENKILLISDPLKLQNFLKSWRRASIEVPAFSVESLISDQDFDEFLRWATNSDQFAVIDPVFDENSGRLLSGIPLVPIEFAMRAEEFWQ